jgi:hypothetical protein
MPGYTAEERFVIEAARRGYRVLRAGWPDYLIIGADNHVEFVEVKHYDEPLRGSQGDVLRALKEAGLLAWIAVEGSFETGADAATWPEAKPGRPTGSMSSAQISKGTAAQYRWKRSQALDELSNAQTPEETDRARAKIDRFTRLLERPEIETDTERRERVKWIPENIEAKNEARLASIGWKDERNANVIMPPKRTEELTKEQMLQLNVQQDQAIQDNDELVRLANMARYGTLEEKEEAKRILDKRNKPTLQERVDESNRRREEEKGGDKGKTTGI